MFAFGFAYLAIGFSYVLAEPMTPVRWALRWIPIDFWILGVLWMVCGVIAIVAAFVPLARDKPGFWALSIAPALWTTAYFISWILVMTGDYTAPRALVSVFVFWLIATAVDSVAGMADAQLVIHTAEWSNAEGEDPYDGSVPE